MTLPKVRCPECDGVLKIAKPPAPGKKIKCPKCGAKFELGDEEPAPAAPKKGGAKGKITPEKPKEAGKPAKPSAKDDDDDEGGKTYGFIKENEEEEANKPKISYVPDTSIKDLRGPAQAMVVPPTNLVMLMGALGFFGWLILLIMILIPVLFPISADEGTKILEMNDGLGGVGNVSTMDTEIEEADPPVLQLYGYDLSRLGLYRTSFIVLFMLPFPLVMAYSGTIIMGAVKAQNLESRQAGIAASIMVMLPLNSGGLISVILIVLGFVLRMLMDNPNYILILLNVLLLLAGVGAGIWGLIVLQDEKVIDGFEFVPE